MEDTRCVSKKMYIGSWMSWTKSISRSRFSVSYRVAGRSAINDWDYN